jgi:hypothetical protein
MITVMTGRDRTPQGWRLVNRTGLGADVLAHAAAAPALSRREALERLRDGDGALSVVRVPDGHFKWTLTGSDGRVVAESPAAYRAAETCREAFTDAQRAAWAALSGFRRPDIVTDRIVTDRMVTARIGAGHIVTDLEGDPS